MSQLNIITQEAKKNIFKIFLLANDFSQTVLGFLNSLRFNVFLFYEVISNQQALSKRRGFLQKTVLVTY